MRKPIVAGNWKMNGSKTRVRTLLEQIKANIGEDWSDAVELIVFPPTIFLDLSEQLLTDHPHIKWGAQNVSTELEGAFTGEISAKMLEEFGCRYVLIGHSERRILYGETNKMIFSKFKTVMKMSQLTPILCVGETQAQRDRGETAFVLRSQLDALLAEGQEWVQLLSKAVIAYEPVWAIGTGLTASAEQAQSAHEALRAHIAKYDSNVAKQVRILYGGSVKPENAAGLFSMPDIDGGLVGGAALESDQFLAIARALT